jgi:hypothetical protein
VWAFSSLTLRASWLLLVDSSVAATPGGTAPGLPVYASWLTLGLIGSHLAALTVGVLH